MCGSHGKEAPPGRWTSGPSAPTPSLWRTCSGPLLKPRFVAWNKPFLFLCRWRNLNIQAVMCTCLRVIKYYARNVFFFLMFFCFFWFLFFCGRFLHLAQSIGLSESGTPVPLQTPCCPTTKLIHRTSTSSAGTGASPSFCQGAMMAFWKYGIYDSFRQVHLNNLASSPWLFDPGGYVHTTVEWLDWNVKHSIF